MTAATRGSPDIGNRRDNYLCLRVGQTIIVVVMISARTTLNDGGHAKNDINKELRKMEINCTKKLSYPRTGVIQIKARFSRLILSRSELIKRSRLFFAKQKILVLQKKQWWRR